MKFLFALLIVAISLFGCRKKKEDPDQFISYKSFSITDPITDSIVFTFSIPSAFTPNADGQNEFWEPKSHGLDSSDYYISILDKKGKQVFESNVPAKFWGEGPDQYLLSQQTFTYYIEAKDKHYGEQHVFTGKFVLIR